VVLHRRLVGRDLHGLKIFRDRYLRDTTISERGSAGVMKCTRKRDCGAKTSTSICIKVYRGSVRYCVMFISASYAQKICPTHERRSAFERAIEAKEEYILPARFDHTPLPGLRKTNHYIDLREKTPEEFAALILKKLGRHVS